MKNVILRVTKMTLIKLWEKEKRLFFTWASFIHSRVLSHIIWKAGKDESHKKGNSLPFEDLIFIAVCVTFIFWEFRGCNEYISTERERNQARLYECPKRPVSNVVGTVQAYTQTNATSLCIHKMTSSF